MRPNDVYSTSYNLFLKGMGEQITTLITGVENLPTKIIKALPTSSSSPSKPKIELLPQLDRCQFPKIKYWPKREYRKRKKGKAKATSEDDEDDDPSLGDPSLGDPSLGDPSLDDPSLDDPSLDDPEAESAKSSVTSCYMEDENGDPIPESERDAARAKAKAFWIKLFKNKIAPVKFGAADLDIKEEYYLLMESSFPWLRYCENRWKAEQLWRNHYPPWYHGELKREQEAKDKAAKKAAQRAARETAQKATKEAVEKAAAEGNLIEVDLDSGDVQDDQGKSPKRPRPDDEESGQPKRRRVKVINPASFSRPAPTAITTKRQRVRLMVLVDYIYH